MTPTRGTIRIVITVICLFNTLLSAHITRSVIDFAEQNNPSKVTGKRLAIINELRAAPAMLELSDSVASKDDWWLSPDLHQPAKCFCIGAFAQLGIDLVKCSIQGTINELPTNPGLLLILLIKVIFQGGIPSAILGSAGTWGQLPPLSTSRLASEIAISQMTLECLDRLAADLWHNNHIDNTSYLLGSCIITPTVVSIIHSLLLWAQRKDLQQEKFLIAAILRELGSGPKIQKTLFASE